MKKFSLTARCKTLSAAHPAETVLAAVGGLLILFSGDRFLFIGDGILYTAAWLIVIYLCRRHRRLYIAAGVAALIAAGYFIAVPPEHESKAPVWFFLALLALTGDGFIRGNQDFLRRALQIIRNYTTAVAAAAIIALLLVIFSASFEFLFDAEIHRVLSSAAAFPLRFFFTPPPFELIGRVDGFFRAFENLPGAVFFGTAAAFFLYFEDHPFEDGRLHRFSRLLYHLGGFALIAYTIIFYAYLLKIIISREMPAGGLADMILFYTLGGLFLYALHSLDETRRLHRFYRYFPQLCLAPLLLLYGAIYVRVRDYGLTPDRLYLIVAAAVLTGLTVWHFIARFISYRLILLWCMAGIIFAFLILDTDGITLKSQNARLHRALSAHNITAQNIADQFERLPTERQRQELRRIAEYIHEHSPDGAIDHAVVQFLRGKKTPLSVQYEFSADKYRSVAVDHFRRMVYWQASDSCRSGQACILLLPLKLIDPARMCTNKECPELQLNIGAYMQRRFAQYREQIGDPEKIPQEIADAVTVMPTDFGAVVFERITAERRGEKLQVTFFATQFLLLHAPKEAP